MLELRAFRSEVRNGANDELPWIPDEVPSEGHNHHHGKLDVVPARKRGARAGEAVEKEYRMPGREPESGKSNGVTGIHGVAVLIPRLPL